MSSAAGQPDPSLECWSARIRGRVQGVGYRDSCAREAERLGVNGWVRNRLDGSVEALMLGPPAQLRQLVAWLHRGPPSARVDEVSLTPVVPPYPDCESFERRRTE